VVLVGVDVLVIEVYSCVSLGPIGFGQDFTDLFKVVLEIPN
jgi:hypothetical protein